jgi:hypothetical protein
MQSIYIRFSTPEDRVRGFYELATRSRVGSFPGEVYQVPLKHSGFLTINASLIAVQSMPK